MDFIRGKCRYIQTGANDCTIDELNRGGYKFIQNIPIGGDNDYIIIDIIR